MIDSLRTYIALTIWRSNMVVAEKQSHLALLKIMGFVIMSFVKNNPCRTTCGVPHDSRNFSIDLWRYMVSSV